jgi:hypothetical protein
MDIAAAELATLAVDKTSRRVVPQFEFLAISWTAAASFLARSRRTASVAPISTKIRMIVSTSDHSIDI